MKIAIKTAGLLMLMMISALNAAITKRDFKRETESCFPINNYSFVAGAKSFNGLSELDFNQILDRFQSEMGPVVKERMNKKLIIQRRWDNSTVDAFATRDEFNNPVIVINGGLARHPLMTKDGFLLLVCHELGHHLGGAPKILRGTSGLRSWSSAEGQADYYSASKCLPRFFSSVSENKNISDFENTSCRDETCSRIALAGLAVSQVFASLINGTPGPSLLLKDLSSVEKTIYNHPNAQCRLDTYLSGATCDFEADTPFDPIDPKIGACIKDQGARPKCWFSEKDY
jgi:hypothetical protein